MGVVGEELKLPRQIVSQAYYKMLSMSHFYFNCYTNLCGIASESFANLSELTQNFKVLFAFKVVLSACINSKANNDIIPYEIITFLLHNVIIWCILYFLSPE